MRLVVLEFGSVARERVRDLWGRLADAGLPNEGEGGYAPHVTLGAFRDLDEAAALRALAPLCRAHPPLRLSFVGLGCFPAGDSVLYAAPVVTRELLALHRAVHAGLEPVATCGSPHYLPDAWVPHTSLGLGLTPEQLAAALALLAPAWQPFAAEASELVLVTPGPPPETRWCAPLG